MKAVGFAATHLRWRAEVLTFAPKGTGTRVTLRIDYDAIGPEVGEVLGLVSRRLQRDLESFKTSVDDGSAARGAWKLPSMAREPSRA